MSNRTWKKRNKRELVWVGLFLLALIGGVYAYQSSAKSAQYHEIVFTNPDGSQSKSIRVELAADDGSRRKGLMFRKQLDFAHGMLFLFPRQEIQRFWMKNTLIPLDMIFIDSSLKVVGMIEDVAPHSTQSRAIDKPSRIVLEVNGGEARQLGIREGATLTSDKPLPTGV